MGLLGRVFGREERQDEPQRTCGEVLGPSHPCTLPDDGHTMHRCAFGDCEWGHR